MARRDRKIGHSEHSSNTHATIQAHFPHYATLAAQGLQPEHVYPEVAAHIAQCATCRAELEELLAINVPAFAGDVPHAPLHRPADLSFLPSRQRMKVWQLDNVGSLIISFSQALLDSLRPVNVVGAGRGQLLHRYVQELGMVPNLNITIEVFAVDQQPEQSCVRVHVELTDRDSFDQGGSIVLLQAAGESWSSTVNDVGDAVFEHIPLHLLPQLHVTITPPSAGGEP